MRFGWITHTAEHRGPAVADIDRDQGWRASAARGRHGSSNTCRELGRETASVVWRAVPYEPGCGAARQQMSRFSHSVPPIHYGHAPDGFIFFSHRKIPQRQLSPPEHERQHRHSIHSPTAATETRHISIRQFQGRADKGSPHSSGDELHIGLLLEAPGNPDRNQKYTSFIGLQ